MRLYHLAGMPAVAEHLRERDASTPMRLAGSDVLLNALASGRLAFEIGGGLPWAVVQRPGHDIGGAQLPPDVVLLASSESWLSSAQIFGTE